VKRVGNLLEQVVSYENLRTAFRLAMRGCGRTEATCRFFFHLEPELLRLQKELETGAYRPGAYRLFIVNDPKKRTIAEAPFRDRIVHHAVVRVLTPVYEPLFIHDSYATRPAKGTHAAVLRARELLRNYPWYFKSDIEKYFESVDHGVLLEILHRKLKDRRFLDLMERIIRNAPVPGKGLPIGNLTSQFLANVYLDRFDHMLRDGLKARGYIRYMDDLVLFGDSRRYLAELRTPVEEYLSEKLGLELKASATCLNRSSHGLSFLGMRIFRGLIRVKRENRRRSIRRLKERIKAWERGDLDEESLIHGMVSTVGHLRYFCPKAPIPLGTGAE